MTSDNKKPKFTSNFPKNPFKGFGGFRGGQQGGKGAQVKFNPAQFKTQHKGG